MVPSLVGAVTCSAIILPSEVESFQSIITEALYYKWTHRDTSGEREILPIMEDTGWGSYFKHSLYETKGRQSGPLFNRINAISIQVIWLNWVLDWAVACSFQTGNYS